MKCRLTPGVFAAGARWRKRKIRQTKTKRRCRSPAFLKDLIPADPINRRRLNTKPNYITPMKTSHKLLVALAAITSLGFRASADMVTDCNANTEQPILTAAQRPTPKRHFLTIVHASSYY